VVAGHEMVGRVEALAKDAQFPIAVGDRVAVDLILRTGLYHEKLLLYGYTMGWMLRVDCGADMENTCVLPRAPT